MYLKSSANLLQNVNDDDNNLEYENKSDVFTMSCLLSKAHNIFYSYKIMIMSEWVSEWVSDCCLTPTQQFFSYIIARTS